MSGCTHELATYVSQSLRLCVLLLPEDDTCLTCGLIKPRSGRESVYTRAVMLLCSIESVTQYL